ncbi:hypothetical protein NMY22_g20212 [Coprinellus aureogranulatus]|nr:hypothetical protein NMY22_g20212 [Coprinellus aureogranulatus]
MVLRCDERVERQKLVAIEVDVGNNSLRHRTTSYRPRAWSHPATAPNSALATAACHPPFSRGRNHFESSTAAPTLLPFGGGVYAAIDQQHLRWISLYQFRVAMPTRTIPITSPPTRSVNASTFHRLDLTLSAATSSGHSIHSALYQIPLTPEHETISVLGGEAPPSKRSKAVSPLNKPPSTRSQSNPPAVAEAASTPPAA